MEDYKSNHNGVGAVSIVDEVDKEVCLEEALDGLPEDRQNKIRRIVTVAQESSFTGPLPLPSHFEGYNKVLPGAAEPYWLWLRDSKRWQRNSKITTWRKRGKITHCWQGDFG